MPSSQSEKESSRVILKTAEDLEAWMFYIETKGRSKKVWDIINGTEKAPAAGNAATIRSFEQRQSVACELIVDTVDRSLFPHLLGVHGDSAKQYKRLTTIMSVQGLNSHSSIWERFDSLRMSSHDTAISYIGRFRLLHSQLELFNDKPSDTKSIITLLRGLPHTQQWKLFRNVMDSDLQSDDLEYVIGKIAAEYAKQVQPKTIWSDNVLDVKNEDPVVKSEGDSTALIARSPARFTQYDMLQNHLKSVVCHTCGGRGHYKSQCPSKANTGEAHATVTEVDDVYNVAMGVESVAL